MLIFCTQNPLPSPSRESISLLAFLYFLVLDHANTAFDFSPSSLAVRAAYLFVAQLLLSSFLASAISPEERKKSNKDRDVFRGIQWIQTFAIPVEGQYHPMDAKLRKEEKDAFDNLRFNVEWWEDLLRFYGVEGQNLTGGCVSTGRCRNSGTQTASDLVVAIWMTSTPVMISAVQTQHV
jgi:hypothetical protein